MCPFSNAPEQPTLLFRTQTVDRRIVLKFVDVEGVKTRYVDRARGEVVLLVRGSHMGTPDASESALDWEVF